MEGNKMRQFNKQAAKMAVWIKPFFISLTFTTLSAMAFEPAQHPLCLTEANIPVTMLIMGKDHNLYYEAYNDASDLTDDGELNIGYQPDQVDYYGYFDSNLCYSYNDTNNYFQASDNATNKTCSSNWSGDFLNYLTMTRIDLIRRALYGGKRSTDSAGETILERSHIPRDAHSWAKGFDSSDIDISLYSPYTKPSSNTVQLFANVSFSETGAPKLLIKTDQITEAESKANKANKAVADWASKENPVLSDEGKEKIELIVRVKVCTQPDGESLNESWCKQYNGSTTNTKPVGVLHSSAENSAMEIGLITGSYDQNLSGGVLRRNSQPFSNEINTDGTFKAEGIAFNLNKLQTIKLDKRENGQYFYDSDCGFITDGSITDGKCVNWGNPIGEMVYESLRYFAGEKAATSTFTTNDTNDAGLGLTKPNWQDPFKQDGTGAIRQCIKPFNLIVSELNPSFDSDQVPGSAFAATGTFGAGLTGADAQDDGNAISTLAGNISNHYIGEVQGATGEDSESVNTPTAKSVSGLGDIRGLAPNHPTKQGSYSSAAAAYWARTHDIRSDQIGIQTVETLVVALSSPLPEFNFSFAGDKKITLIPYGLSVGGGWDNVNIGEYKPVNSIVDFYVLETNDDGEPTKVQVMFEDMEVGADHELDALVEYTFIKGTSTLEVETTVIKSGNDSFTQHLGYIISGTGGFENPPTRPNACSVPVTPDDKDGKDSSYNDVYLRGVVNSWGATRMSLQNDNEWELSVYLPAGDTTFKFSNEENNYKGFDINNNNNISFYAPHTGPYKFTINDSTLAYSVEPEASSSNTQPTPPNNADGIYMEVSDDTFSASASAKKYKLSTVQGEYPYPNNGSANCGPLDTISNTRTFTVSSTAIPATLLKSPLWYAAKYGGYKGEWNGTSGSFEWDEDNNGIPDAFYLASNPSKLEEQLNSAFGEIAQRTGLDNSGVAVGAGNLQQGTTIFQTTYSSADWSGTVRAVPLSMDGETITIDQASWSSNDYFSANSNFDFSNRLILSADSSGDGKLFEQADILNIQSPFNSEEHQEDIFKYIKGDSSNEEKNGGGFRDRNLLLGDVVNSTPIYSGAPKERNYTTSYNKFKADYNKRTPVLIFGANDGMVHILDASETDNAGNELFSYIPTQMKSKLHLLANPEYNNGTNHQFFVDGSINIIDSLDADNKWRTVAIGSLGAGGKGYYALDISDPDPTTTDLLTGSANTFSGSTDTAPVLWEKVTGMGYVMNAVSYTQIKIGEDIKRVALLNNGYDSGQLPSVHIIDPVTGTSYKTITVPDDSSCIADLTTYKANNGLSAIAPFSSSSDGITDILYAGDLKGSLWSFDLSDSKKENWNATCIFQAQTDTAGVTVNQPITAAPRLGMAPGNNGTMVYFGTGKFIENKDKENLTQQSFYALWDKKETTTSLIAKSNLQKQTINQTTVDGKTTRALTTETWSADTQLGWYFDFPGTAERMINRPLLLWDELYLTTLIPDTTGCGSGCKSWHMRVNALDATLIDSRRQGCYSGDASIVLGTEDALIISGISAGCDNNTEEVPDVTPPDQYECKGDDCVIVECTGDDCIIDNDGVKQCTGADCIIAECTGDDCEIILDGSSQSGGGNGDPEGKIIIDNTDQNQGKINIVEGGDFYNGIISWRIIN